MCAYVCVFATNKLKHIRYIWREEEKKLKRTGPDNYLFMCDESMCKNVFNNVRYQIAGDGRGHFGFYIKSSMCLW